MNLKIISDSSCDLTKELAEQYNIDIVPFYISYGDEKYYKDYYELTKDEFYKTLQEKECRPKTSMPTLADYYDVFVKYAKAGNDILCVCLTAKFSGSYNCARLAMEQIKEQYPHVNIEVVDSALTCIMQGHLAMEARRLSDSGLNVSEIANRLNLIKGHSGAAITVDSLVYLQRGGRIGKVSSIAGDLLNIKPLIMVTEGELIPHSKVRTRKKAKDKVIDMAMEMTSGFKAENVSYFAVHTAAVEEAHELARMFTEKTGIAIREQPSTLSCTVGAHIGPSVIGIGFFVNE